MFGIERQDDAKTADPALVTKWRTERGLLDIIADEPDEIIGFITECNGADLHQFGTILGLRQEIEIYYTILNHPDCDRATALNIFMACDPAYYDHALSQGKDPEDLMDEEDQVFLAIAVAAHAVLTSDRSWKSRFRINNFAQWHDRPRTNPLNYKFFKLPQKVLGPTKCEYAESPIVVEYSTIGLSFAAWTQKH